MTGLVEYPLRGIVSGQEDIVHMETNTLWPRRQDRGEGVDKVAAGLENMRRIDEQHVAAREFGEDTRGRVLDPLDPEGMLASQATQERARIGFNRSDAQCSIEEA